MEGDRPNHLSITVYHRSAGEHQQLRALINQTLTKASQSEAIAALRHRQTALSFGATLRQPYIFHTSTLYPAPHSITRLSETNVKHQKCSQYSKHLIGYIFFQVAHMRPVVGAVYQNTARLRRSSTAGNTLSRDEYQTQAHIRRPEQSH